MPCDTTGVKNIPRDSSGNHSLPPGTIVNSGDTVLPSQHNPAMQDISQSLTGSLPRNGSGPMLADLPMNNNRVRQMANGVDPSDGATFGQLQGLGIPLGVVVDFWGSTIPNDFMLCAGQEVSRTEYAALFAIIGTNAGAGNGTTTFNLPDYRGRVGAGLDNMGGAAANRLTGMPAATFGGVGGASTVTLTMGQIPGHTHTGTTNTTGAHTHSINLYTSTQEQQLLQSSTSRPGLQGSTNTGSAGNHAHSFTTNSVGGGGSHPNIQPTIVCNKIIRIR